MKYDDWYVWVHMEKSAITMPVFQSLDAYWPGLQVSTTTNQFCEILFFVTRSLIFRRKDVNLKAINSDLFKEEYVWPMDTVWIYKIFVHEAKPSQGDEGLYRLEDGQELMEKCRYS